MCTSVVTVVTKQWERILQGFAIKQRKMDKSSTVPLLDKKETFSQAAVNVYVDDANKYTHKITFC